MYTLLLVLLSMATSYATTYNSSLLQQGFSQGIHALENFGLETVYFRLPSYRSIKSAVLHLEIESSPLLKRPSHLKVMFEGVPLLHINLQAHSTGSEMIKLKQSVEVPTSLLQNNFGRLEFQFVNMITGDLCVDEMMNAGTVRVTEKSNLELNLIEKQMAIGDHLLTLPNEVKLFIPDRKLSAAEFKNVYQIAAFLKSQAKTLSFTTQRENATIIMASRKELTKPGKSDNDIFWVASENEKNILFVAFSEFSVKPLLNSNFGLFNQAVSSNVKNSILNDQTWLIRDQLSLSAKGVETNNGPVWTIPIGPYAGISNLIPHKLHLSMTVAKSQGNSPVAAYVYLGEELLEVIHLEDGLLPQYHSVELPKILSYYPDKLRIQVRGNDPLGKCRNKTTNDYGVRLLEDSALELAPVKDFPSSFSGFAQKAQKGHQIVLSDAAFSAAHEWISALIYLQDSFKLNPDLAQITSVPSVVEIASIKIDQAPEDKLYEFPYKGGEMYQISPKDKLALIKVTTAGQNQLGLEWTFLGKPFNVSAPALNPDKNDLFLLSQDRIELISNSHSLQKQIQKKSNDNAILSLLNKWRYLFLGLAWLILTVIFLKLAKKFR